MPSSFPGYFPAVWPVEPGNVIQSEQQKQLADALNARILSGLGDIHWRSIFAASSLVRNFRRPDGGGLYGPEDEWWLLYGLYKETDWDWPTAAVGDPEGLNKDCPVVGYFFGSQDGSSIDDEDERLNDNVPLREPPVIGPAPSEPVDFWELGKEQRGAVDPADLTDLSIAWAMYAARIMNTENSTIVELDAKHKTAGGKIKDASNEYIREKGEQWNAMENQFLKEWRGSATEREDDPNWVPSELTVAYEAIFEGQWFLAPAYGAATGSGGSIEAQYPLFEWDALDTAGTYGTVDATDNIDNHTGFSFVGFILQGSNLGASYRAVGIEIDGVQVHILRVNSSETSSMIWFPTPWKGNLKIQLLGNLLGSEDIWVEVAELMDHKPETFDVYTLIRMANARSNSPTIYRGAIVSDAVDISDSYFTNGCIYNSTNATVPTETKLAKYPPYQAIRDFLINWFRVVNYDRLVGYYVNGDGNSVLVFDRRGKGDSDADIFQGLAPQEDPDAGGASTLAVTSIVPDVWYIVEATGASPSGSVTYDGKTYEIGETFRGTYQRTFTFNSPVNIAVKEDHFLIDIDDVNHLEESNEWVFSIGGSVPFKDTGGATYKPSAYGDIYGFLTDRCHVFSTAWSSSTGTPNGKLVGKYAANHSAGQSIVTRAETPPGHRYAGDEVPYVDDLGGVVNDLIAAADDPSTVTDCRDSIFQEYTSGGTPEADLDPSDCAGITAHFESCQVFKAPYLIKSISHEGSSKYQVEVELRGRLDRTGVAPASIADTSASRTTYLSTDTGARSDENLVIGLLKWKVDGGPEDEERIGDISPNADSDYNAADIKGSVLCRFFFQRLMPKVWNDANHEIELDRDRRAFSDPMQYAEFIVRAGVSGFLDEQKVIDTMVYHSTGGGRLGASSYCDNQDSADLTMTRLVKLVNDTDDENRLPFRRSGDHPGFGALPNTKMRANMWKELGQAINLLKSSRFEVPVFLQSKTLTYWFVVPWDVESIEGWLIARDVPYSKPPASELKNDTGWIQETIPFGTNAESYMTIYNDGATTGVLMYWREVKWRMRPHPKVLAAVPEILRDYADDGGLAVPFVHEPASLVRAKLLRDPEPGDVLTDFTGLETVSAPNEICDIGQSGDLSPKTPPTGTLVTATAGTGTPGGTAGDAESYSRTSMGVEATGERYIRVPVR